MKIKEKSFKTALVDSMIKTMNNYDDFDSLKRIVCQSGLKNIKNYCFTIIAIISNNYITEANTIELMKEGYNLSYLP